MEKQIRTTLILRNDTSVNWAASSLVLKKGEVGFDTDLHIFKVGDGTKTWSQIETHFVDFAAVEKAINDATKNLHTTDVYQKEIALGGDKAAALAEITSPVKGDIAIIKETLEGGKYQYTAYVRGETNWEAMDGNYDAENVYFQKDLTITADIGVQTIPSSGSKTLSTRGKNIKQVFDMIVASEKNPSTTQPSVTLNSSNIGAKEVGTNIAIAYSFATNPGSYTYGPATGVTFSGYEATFNGETLTGASGIFTNLGNPYEAGKIAAKNYTPSKGTLTGYRGWFYGYYNGTTAIADPAAITSAQLRAFGTKTNFPTTMNTSQMQQMFFAAPKGRVSSVSISNAVNGAPLTVTKGSASVEGANGYTAAEYDLFYVANAVAEGGDSKWNIVAK